MRKTSAILVVAFILGGCARIDVADHLVAPSRYATQWALGHYHDENPFCSDYKSGLGPNYSPRAGQIIVGNDNSLREWGAFDSCWEVVDHQYFGFVLFDVSGFADNIVHADLIFQREAPSDAAPFQIYQPSKDWKEGFYEAPEPWFIQFPIYKAEDRPKFFVDDVDPSKKTVTINVTDIVRSWVRKTPGVPANHGFVILPTKFTSPRETSRGIGFFGNFRLVITTPKT